MTVKANVLALRDKFRPDIKTVAELERKIGLSNGIISQWEKNTPSPEKAELVAKFFKVPVTRIYGTDSDDSVNLDPSEEELITLFRKNTSDLSEEEKARFNKSFDTLMKAAKNLMKESD